MLYEHGIKRTILGALGLAPALLVAALLGPAVATAAGPITTTACSADVLDATVVTCNLWAKSGTLSLPGASVTIWGFSDTAGGAPTLPGPALVVNAGDKVTVYLHNTLGQPTSLLFDGVAMVPDQAVVAAGGGTHAYKFTAGAPGTYLYEAGLTPGTQYQVSMGLAGVLVVRPAGLPGQAYADPATAFDDEALVVLSEIDPTLNNSAAPWAVDLRAFAPRFFLVNGTAYTSAAAAIATASGSDLLLRYVNAGIQHRSIGVLGLHQRVLAADGSQLSYPRTMVAETIAPGQSADVLVTMPVTTATSTRYALYDASLALNNSTASGIGGMLAFIDASGTPTGTDGVGPVTSGVALDLGTGGLTASVTDTATGASTVDAAEYFIDTTGSDGTGTAMSGAFGTDPVAVSATVPPATLAALSSGTHTVYVHGRDAAGNWGAVSSTTFAVDRAGPTTSALTLNPNPSSGTVSVALAGTASDAATGNGNVTAAEYFLGAPGPDGTGTVVARNTTAPVVSLSATIPAGPGGVVSVHARDAAGNWGPYATITMTVDGTGPATTAVTANPPSTNGTTGQSSGNPSVRISAALSDAASGGSTITTAEGFIDTVGSTGTGFPFVATDGVFDEITDPGFADVPLSTINQLPSGNHTIHVHARDAAGNWGATASVTILVDRTAPTFTGISLAPSPTLGAATVTLTVNGATDPLSGGLASGVTGGAWWIDSAPPAPGGGTAFSGTTASIPTAGLSTGNHTIGARIRDAAGNWSTTTSSATVFVVPDAIFSNGFDTGGAPWGWSSRSTTSTTRLSVVTSPALVGTRSLRAQGNNSNYVQFNFGAAANPAWPTYDARFYFRPNGNTSSGKDILAAATSNTFGTTLFHVRYRLSGGTPQVQIQVGATANATWTSVLGGTSNNVIEVVWQAVGSGGPGAGSLVLSVNGVTAQTLATTSTASVGAVRLGSVTNAGNTAFMYFDAFASKRTVSPLVGP